jgi:hypothetical protein
VAEVNGSEVFVQRKPFGSRSSWCTLRNLSFIVVLRMRISLMEHSDFILRNPKTQFLYKDGLLLRNRFRFCSPLSVSCVNLKTLSLY